MPLRRSRYSPPAEDVAAALASMDAPPAESRGNPLERPGVSIGSPEAIAYLSGLDVPQYQGRRLSPDAAMRISAVFACVNVLGQAIGQLPATVIERGRNGSRVPVDDHPVSRLFDDSPGADLSPIVFKEMGTAHAATRGNFVAIIRWDGRGAARELEPVHPTRVSIRRDGRDRVYDVRQDDGSTRSYASRDIFHVHGLAWDGVGGISVVRCAMRSFGLTDAAEELGERFFGNGARPSGFLEVPGVLSDPVQRQQLKDELSGQHGGSANAGKTMVLDGGKKWHQISIAPDEAQFLETRKFQVNDICRWFRVPPHMVGDLERSTNNNIEHQAIEFVQNSVMPWVLRWEEEANRKLFPQRKHRLKLNVNALMRGDHKTRGEWYRSLFSIGAINQNEVRAWEDIDPFEGGDRHWVQGAYVPIDQAGQQPAPQPPAPPPGDADSDDPDGGEPDEEPDDDA